MISFPEQPTATINPEAVWLNVSPHFDRLDRKLLCCLAGHYQVAQWAYCQTPDEPSSLDIALTLLHDFLRGKHRPVHLLGHGTGGLLGLLYARKYPSRVRSLTLLSVGVNPMVDWQAHYYKHLEKLPCSRQQILTQMAYSLFGYQAKPLIRSWVNLLEIALLHSPSPHSLLKRVSLFPGGVPVPLMVCGGEKDPIIEPHHMYGWQPWLKPEDRIWICPEGRHFFHGTFPQQVASQILGFWEASAPSPLAIANQKALG
jgi:pimeloyl-ACP methyl ester carboxylesterase